MIPRAAGLIFLLAITWSIDAVAVDNTTSGEPGAKAVLVTGASSGIGRKITEALAANGYFVYAGARKQKDLDDLDALDNVQSIRLDVTVQDEIDAAVRTVQTGGRGLYALINNAGVLITGPSAEISVEQVEWLFDVNVFGVYRVTQAFAPLIIESRGRILNMSSIAGSIGVAFLGPYSMSKHAIEAYTDALATEMERFGVHASLLAPGTYSSRIWNSDIARARQAAVVGEDSPYFEDFQEWINMVANLDSKEPDAVAAAALAVLAEQNPARRYLVVPNDEEMEWVTGSIVQRLAELNANHEYSYSNDELNDMLNREIAANDRSSNVDTGE